MTEMNLKTLLPELNDNQHKMLQRTLLEIIEKAKDTAAPLSYIEKKVKELFV